jgi:hypothetical protein
MSNTRGAFLAAREIVYILKYGEPMLFTPRGFTSGSELQSMLFRGVVKEVAEYSKIKAIAREAVLTRTMKGLSKAVKNYIIHILNTGLSTLYREAVKIFLIDTNSLPSSSVTPFKARHPGLKQNRLTLDVEHRKNKRQFANYIDTVTGYKDSQKTKGITVTLLERIMNDILPGVQPGRKDKILNDLIKYFNLDPNDGNKAPVKSQPIEFVVPSETPLSTSRDEMKQFAANIFVQGVMSELSTLTYKIRENLKDYKDKDAIDTRQRVKMQTEISPIPLVYVDKSDTSPRMYSKEADNLFACRKNMRLAALKGLGAIDVDMRSCHTYILLAEWGDKLPLLKQAIKEETLWKVYQEHYESHGHPFHKKAVKAIHYASFLGGGNDAFEEAIHRFNLDNPDEPVNDTEALIKVHKKSPIYKELRRLLRHLDKTWHGKTLSLATGEKFLVKGMRRWKDRRTGKVVVDKGNLLTALSAFLQSKEVVLISYLILETHHLFTPILIQHDGITIIPRDSSYLEAMGKVMKVACTKLLGEGIIIPLDVSPIP